MCRNVSNLQFQHIVCVRRRGRAVLEIHACVHAALDTLLLLPAHALHLHKDGMVPARSGCTAGQLFIAEESDGADSRRRAGFIKRCS